MDEIDEATNLHERVRIVTEQAKADNPDLKYMDAKIIGYGERILVKVKFLDGEGKKIYKDYWIQQ